MRHTLQIHALILICFGASAFPSPKILLSQQRQGAPLPSRILTSSATSTTTSSTPFLSEQEEPVPSASVSCSSKPTKFGAPVGEYHQVTVPTSQSGPPRQDISVEDLTPILNALLQQSRLQHGTITVISRHTTTAVTINERECRLARDLQTFLWKLAPPDERSDSSMAREGIRYLHNDIHQRPESLEEKQRCLDNGWDIDDPVVLQAWRNQEPINAHSHLLSMLLGSSEAIPVVNGKMVIGQWQSVLLVDLDGPRERTVGVQLMGYQ